MTAPNYAGPIASLPQYLAAQLEASRSGQLELVQQWQQQQHASQAYLQLLEQVLTSLLKLVQDHQLGQQQVSFLTRSLLALPLLVLPSSPVAHDTSGTGESFTAGVKSCSTWLRRTQAAKTSSHRNALSCVHEDNSVTFASKCSTAYNSKGRAEHTVVQMLCYSMMERS